MSGLGSRDFSRNEYNNLKILLLQSQFIFSLYRIISYYLRFMILMRCSFDLYQPHSNLISYQKGAYYFGIRLFNGLPLYIKKLAHNANSLDWP